MDIDIDVEVDVDIDRYFGCLERVSKSVQVPLNGIETFMVLTLILLKYRALILGCCLARVSVLVSCQGPMCCRGLKNYH